jgi:hypothetical protein
MLRFGIAGIFCSLLLAEGLHIKPGLWEATTANNIMAAMMPEEKLAQMPPAQRAQIEAMMKQANNQPPVKVCYTKEQIDSGMRYNMDRAGNSCRTTVVSSAGSKQVSEMACDNGKNKTTGTITFETQDPEHYTGLVQMHTNASGPGKEMTIKIAAKWVGSDCGDVKPHDYAK